MDLNCANCGKKIGVAHAPSFVEIKCRNSECKKTNEFILTIKEENQIAAEPQSFIKNYEKTAVSIRIIS